MLSEAVRAHFLSRLKVVAGSRDGHCLSTTYICSHSKMRWKCAKDHEWQASPNNIFRGKWCPSCARIELIETNKHSLKKIKDLGVSRGGELVSTSYRNSKTPLIWHCGKGHEFNMTAGSVLSGRWCHVCSRERAGSITRKRSSQKKELAQKKAIAVLIRAGVKLQRVPSLHQVIGLCSHGHESENSVLKILSDGWTCSGCQRDARDAVLFRRAKELAAKHQGRVEKLSPAEGRRLKWLCNLGHVWTANIDNIAHGTWCPQCADKVRGLRRRIPLASLKNLASSRRGACLGVNYERGRAIGHWRCFQGHEWSTSISSIKAGSWCARCAGGISERICRVFFESLFSAPFPKVRPDWLRTETGTRLELDGYNETLQIAFEHQGRQHYMPSKHLQSEFPGIVSRDQRKAKLCHEKGVRLIAIPELGSDTKLEILRDVIAMRCRAVGMTLPPNFENVQVNLAPAFVNEDVPLLSRISSRNGQLIGPVIAKRGLQFRVKCERGHTFQAAAVRLRRGQWCPYCSGRHLSIGDMRTLAQSFGGKCLSRRYVASKAILRWECDKGHQFYLPHSKVKQGRWCQVCAREKCASAQRGSLEPVAEAARRRGGSVLSLGADYRNRQQLIEVVCAKGHRWFARGSELLKGSWCGKCAGIQRLSLEILQQFAAQKGGKCLAVEYQNAHQKAEWECGQSHRWIAEITNILHNGRWCPKCARSKSKDKKVSKAAVLRDK
jgi:hypothetical protein